MIFIQTKNKFLHIKIQIFIFKRLKSGNYILKIIKMTKITLAN